MAGKRIPPWTRRSREERACERWPCEQSLRRDWTTQGRLVPTRRLLGLVRGGRGGEEKEGISECNHERFGLKSSSIVGLWRRLLDRWVLRVQLRRALPIVDSGDD